MEMNEIKVPSQSQIWLAYELLMTSGLVSNDTAEFMYQSAKSELDNIEGWDEEYEHMKRSNETQGKRLTYDTQGIMVCDDVFCNEDYFRFVYPNTRRTRDIFIAN